MCGSTLLACPWGFHESGLIPSVLSIIIVGLCSYYTCTLIIKHTTMQGEDDFGDVSVKVLGKWSQYLALIVSVVILVGAAIAYHMIMRDCLLSIVDGLFSVNKTQGYWYWNQYWASFVIFLILFPLVNLKKLTILVKFNSFGVFFVCFLIFFIFFSCTLKIVDTLKHPPTNISYAMNSKYTSILENLSFNLTKPNNNNLNINLNHNANLNTNIMTNYLKPFQSINSNDYSLNNKDNTNKLSNHHSDSNVAYSSLINGFQYEQSNDNNLKKFNTDKQFLNNNFLNSKDYKVLSQNINTVDSFSINTESDTTSNLNTITNTITNSEKKNDPWKPLGIPLFGKNSAHLLGILSLSFFIHNAIASILKNQKSTKSYRRTSCEVFIAFFLAALTYGIPGVMGLIAFRYDNEVNQNFLNQFPNNDVLATIARFAIMLQLLSIFPLLIFIIRVQFFGFLLQKQYPGFVHVLILSTICCLITMLFAMFFPNVGTVLQYCGAICGLVYLYILPIFLHVKVYYEKSRLRWYSVVGHTLLLIFGISILVSQFIPFEKFI